MPTAAAINLEPSLAGRAWGWLSEQGAALGILILVFVAWEIACRALTVPVYILPSPSVILVKIYQDWALLMNNAWASLQEIVLGFGLSVVVGIPLAVAIVYSRIFERVAFPLMVSLQTVPKVALAPILVMWFGYGILPKVLVAFLISFFPIVINTVIGMRSVEKEMIYLAESMGASQLQTFVKIRFPKALPSIFGGLKVGIGQAVIGAIVGEFIAAEEGLGYLQLIAQVRLDTPLLFSAVVILSLMGVILFNVVAWVERLVIPWHRQITERVE
ncbi:MAG: ABC transporter permease [Betaproteobacteria bacterium]